MKMDRSMREAFGDALVELGNKHKELVVLDADVSNSTRTVLFGQEFPERFFNMGVAEAGMVSVAGGLASCGFRPIVSTFAVFLTLKATEQIRNIICYNHLPVIIAGGYAGLSDSFDGASHQSVEDIAVMRALPNIRILVPPAASSVEHLLKSAIESNQPSYFRLCRNPLPQIEEPDESPYNENVWQISKGHNITLVACGVPSYMAVEAGKRLELSGISAEVLIVSTIKPFDPTLVNNSIKITGKLLTIEEHSIIGGLRSVILETCQTETSFKIDSIAISDVFGETGEYEELLAKHGLTVENIVNKCKNLLSE